jgi:hypothetical protein
MAWCEGNGVDFLFGMAMNERLIAEITPPGAGAPAGPSAASRTSCG